MTVEIRPVRLPASAEDADADELVAYTEFVRRHELEQLGTADLAHGPREVLVMFGDTDHRAHRALGAFDGAHLVGVAELEWELDDDDATTAFLTMLAVEAGRRREGIGTRLLARAEAVAAEAGRPTLIASGEHLLGRDGTGPRLAAPQGEATIAGDAPAARFAAARGYALGQLDRVSVLDVAGRADEFRGRLAALGPSAPYRVVTWADRAPDDLLGSLAHAHERMSVDAPSGAISFEFEHWNGQRIRDGEAKYAAMGRTTLEAAAIDPDGSVAGFTTLSLLEGSAAAEQWDTIVLTAHRGHRLGMRLKLANLVQLAEVDPARERIYTWNADENDHMLAINVDLGFRAFALESVWQRS